MVLFRNGLLSATIFSVGFWSLFIGLGAKLSTLSAFGAFAMGYGLCGMAFFAYRCYKEFKGA